MSLRSFGRSDPRWLVLILVLSALTAVAVALLAWFLLPLLPVGGAHPFEGEAPRLVAILVIVLAWGAANALLRAQQNSANQARLDALERQDYEDRARVSAADAATEAAFADVRAAARYAFRRVRGRRLRDLLIGRGRGLPRYLVVGPSGSGKTTLLGSANLSLPFDPRENETPAAPPCRFVVSERAVFIDVEGGLVLGSDAARRSLWPRLLGLLRSLRRLKPIHGVLVVVAASDIAIDVEEGRADVALSLRRCLDEVVLRLGVRVPVYLLLSKVDRLVGFAEFFEHLGADERSQAWGVAVAPPGTAAAGARAAFAQSFDDLVRRASTRQLGFLHAEPDETRRTPALEFPAHLAALRDRLGELVEALLRQSRFEDAPLLRGIFLTSALQDGATVDALGGTLSHSFALAPQGLPRRGGGERVRRRPYFLKRLFSDVILGDAAIGGPSEGARRRQGSLRIATRALAAVVLLVGLYQVWSSYGATGAYVNGVIGASEVYRASLAKIAAQPGVDNLGPTLTALDALSHVGSAAAAAPAATQDSVKPVRNVATAVQRQGLNDMLMPGVMRALEALLSDPATPAFELYQGLKLYLLLGAAQNPDPALMAALDATIAANFGAGGGEGTLRQSLIERLDALASSPLLAQDLDQGIVARARRRLDKVAVAQVGYELLKRAPAITALKPWRPLDHAGSLGSRAIARASGKLLSSGIAGLYTAAEIGTVGSTAASVGIALNADAWVFTAGGEQTAFSARTVGAGILDLYRADYTRTWESLLSDLTVPTVPSAAAGAELVAILAGPDSPILQLLGAVAAETDPGRRFDDKVPQSLVPSMPKLGLVEAALSSPEIASPTSATRKSISAQFAGLRDALARPKDGQGSEIDVILKSLDPLYRQLLLIGSGATVPDAQSPATNVALVAASIKRLPASIRPYFTQLTNDMSGLLKVNLRGRAATSWAENGRPACEAAVAKAFPFDLSSTSDVPLGEFTRLFSPNGLIADFRRTQLGPLVDTSVHPWRWRDSRSAPSDPPDPTLAAFERADAITAAFFPEGDRPGVRFIATPLRVDTKITRYQLDIGGANLVYAHGPIVPFTGQWPPPIADAPATLSVQPEVDGVANSIVGSGPWGLFRLLGQARAAIRTPDAMQFTFDFGRRRLQLQMATPTLRNAFDLGVTGGFTCPRF